MSESANNIAIFISLTDVDNGEIEINPTKIDVMIRTHTEGGFPTTTLYVGVNKFVVEQTPEDITQAYRKSLVDLTQDMMNLAMDSMKGFETFFKDL